MQAFRLAGWGSVLLALVAATGCGTVQVEPDADPSVTIDGGAATDSGPGGPDASPVVQELAASPVSVEFGILLIDTESVAATVQFTNSGTVSTGGLARQLVGADLSQFSIDSDTCNGAVLDPNESCEVNIRFKPSSVGDKVGAIVVGDSVVRAEVPVRGTALAPGALTLTPSTHLFPNTLVGSNSPVRVFTVENTGGVVSGAVAVTLSDTANFSITADTCTGNTVAAGATCSITARFSPAASGSQVGSISATASPGGTAVASLSGTGLSPANLSMSLSSHAFGNVILGGSKTQPFTLTNTGNQTSGTVSVTTSGDSSYSVTNNTCTGTLAGGASCTFNVKFGPTTAGTKSGTVAAAATPGGSVSAALTGTGQVVNYTLTVISRHEPGASGTVTSSPGGISCASLAGGRTCTASFTSGTSVTLTKSPGTGTTVSVFSGDCGGTGPTCNVTMNGNKSVTAEFFGLLL